MKIRPPNLQNITKRRKATRCLGTTSADRRRPPDASHTEIYEGKAQTLTSNEEPLTPARSKPPEQTTWRQQTVKLRRRVRKTSAWEEEEGPPYRRKITAAIMATACVAHDRNKKTDHHLAEDEEDQHRLFRPSPPRPARGRIATSFTSVAGWPKLASRTRRQPSSL